jgi:PAS domain S-box-containing protein
MQRPVGLTDMPKHAAMVVRIPLEIAVVCVTVVAMLWAALIFDIDRSQKLAIKQAASDAGNLAVAFRENVKRTVSAIDQLMLTIIAENNASGGPFHIPPWVESSPLLSGLSVQVSASGPDGVMVASSLGVSGRVDISDRPHFRYHLDPSAPQPYISTPVIGRNSGKWSIQVTRRITAKDGSFGGVLVVSMDPLYFSQFFETVDLGPNGVVDLVDRDGVVRARRGRDSQQIGQNVAGTALFKEMQHSSAGSDIIRSKLDGVTRIYGYSSVDDYPLVVVVGLGKDDVLAGAYWQRDLDFAVGAILSLVIVTLSWFLARETKRRRARELASLAEAKVREQKVLLDTAVNNMRHGLLMFDSDGRAVVINQSYVDMYRLSPETTKPGCTMRDLLEHRRANGTFSGEIEDYLKNLLDHDTGFDKVFEIPDGRSIRVVNRFMDNGGWVSVHEDVTERQRLLEAQQHSEKIVTEQKRQLDAALNNMTQGLCMFDPEGHIVLSNRRYNEMMGQSAEQLQGLLLLDLMKNRRVSGAFGGDPDEFFSRLMTDMREGRTVIKEMVSGDGVTVRVVDQPIAGGGWVATFEDITEQRKAQAAVEHALAEAERAGREVSAAHTRLREAFEVVPEALALFDAEDRYVMWNERCAQLYTQSPDAIQVGTRFEDVLRAGLAAGQYPEAHGRESEWLAERLALHAQDNSTHEQRLADGRWLRICERRTADGGSVGIRIDITELKQREESVRMLFEVNPVPMFVIDCDDLKFLAINDTAVREYGYSREQFLAMTKLDLHPPEDRQRYLELFSEFRKSGRPEFDSATIRRHRKADGDDILVTLFGRRLNYFDRPALLCSIINVTERVRAEEERDRNRELLDRIIENITMTIVVKDARTLQYVLTNKAAERLWGISRDELIGKTVHQIFDGETADAIDRHDRHAIEARSNHYTPEHKIETPRNGTRLVTSNRIVIHDQNGEVQYLLGVLEDVTERKAVEDQLRQAQKMEAIGNLTGGVAHDFNNLLTVMIGNLDFLQEEVAGNASAEEKIRVILQAAERGADLTRHMLAFSRRQPLQAKEVDVNTLISTTLRLLSRTLGEDITVKLQTTVDAPIALVDPSQLETALLNIAINARDAMPNGGSLSISTRVTELDESYTAHHHGVSPGFYAAIEIADSGSGMPPDVVERIFEPFFTTKAAGHGTGLGLSMVYGFIKQSGGHINVYSELGRGTVFRLFLPLAKPAAWKATAELSAPRATKRAGNEVILAVEDNPDIRATVVRQLRDLGYRVHEADSADAALRFLETGEPIDLLFTDVLMPGGLNGKELAAKARAKQADLKVLFTSGFTGTSTGHGAQLEPGDVLLSKPYHKNDLARAVEQVLIAAAPSIVADDAEPLATADADSALPTAAAT